MSQPSWQFLQLILWSGLVSSLAPTAPATAHPQHPTPEQLDPQTVASHSIAQVVEACEYGGYPKFYARIITNDRDNLNIRANPRSSGAVIGSVPHGWAVRVLSWSRDGTWARIIDHYGGGHFGSAPHLKEGWVAAAYLKDLGRFCDKPLLNDGGAVGQLSQPELLGANPVAGQHDALVLGDALSGMLPTAKMPHSSTSST